jgi:hypothetical protein
VVETRQARTDFAAVESELEVIQKQLARLSTRRELAGTALGIIFATMMLTTLSLLFFLRQRIKSDAWCLRRGSALGGKRA